jgi:beta-1,4-N-acetylglucosaminyltransferase
MRVYTSRTYIISSGDSMSVEKAVAFEKSLNSGPAEGKNYRFIELPRARKVGQSYVSSVWTTILSFRTAFRLLALEPLKHDGRESWDLLLVNGPGTCVVAAVAVMLPRVSRYTWVPAPAYRSWLVTIPTQFLGLYSPRVVYVESWARVKSLSLSGKILRRVADKFVVQWDEVDRCAPAWNSRSGETPPDGKAKKTDLGEYHGWLIWKAGKRLG